LRWDLRWGLAGVVGDGVVGGWSVWVGVRIQAPSRLRAVASAWEAWLWTASA